jgi:hypothetical protein
MNKLEYVTEYLENIEETALSADGFDNAIIGVYEGRIVYSIYKCISILMHRDKMTLEEAQEFFEFNVEGAYVGEKTPIWVDDTMLPNVI